MMINLRRQKELRAVKRVLWCGFVLMFVFFFSTATLYADSKAYHVGCIFAITGKASWLGEPQKNTVEMLAQKINESGGIDGKKLVLHIEDTQGDNTRAVNAVKKLIKKFNVCAILGPSRSGTSMAAIPVAQAANIPLISCASAEIMLQPIEERGWIFKLAQNDSDAVRKIYDHLVKRGLKKVGVITGTTGFGAAGRDFLIKMAPEYGMEIVADETYAPGDTDMTAQLVKIRNSGAQVIVNWSIVPAQSIIPQNMKQLKMEIPLYQSHGFANIKYAQAAGEAAEGLIFPAARIMAVDTLPKRHPQYALMAEYKSEYESTYKDNVSTFGGHAYDGIHLLSGALEKVGDDPAEIRNYIENARFVGTGGIFCFSPKDHCGLDKTAFELLTVKNGKFVVLEP
jgi:branched-chain amino acid transport system substrate-binding protein